MPLITVALVKGRSKAEKDALSRRICQAMKEEMGVAPEAIWIRYEDVDADEWYVGPDTIADRKKAREKAAG